VSLGTLAAKEARKRFADARIWRLLAEAHLLKNETSNAGEVIATLEKWPGKDKDASNYLRLCWAALSGAKTAEFAKKLESASASGTFDPSARGARRRLQGRRSGEVGREEGGQDDGERSNDAGWRDLAPPVFAAARAAGETALELLTAVHVAESARRGFCDACLARSRDAAATCADAGARSAPRHRCGLPPDHLRLRQARGAAATPASCAPSCAASSSAAKSTSPPPRRPRRRSPNAPARAPTRSSPCRSRGELLARGFNQAGAAVRRRTTRSPARKPWSACASGKQAFLTRAAASPTRRPFALRQPVFGSVPDFRGSAPAVDDVITTGATAPCRGAAHLGASIVVRRRPLNFREEPVRSSAGEIRTEVSR
jgi:hypothetical protein